MGYLGASRLAQAAFPRNNNALETCGDPAKAVEGLQRLRIPKFACPDVCSIGAIVSYNAKQKKFLLDLVL